MNKLKLAHDYFMKHGNSTYLETDIAEAWEYADRMIEQEHLREDKTRPEVLLDREWQPDWSQAPEWSNYWAIDFHRVARWYSDEPSATKDDFTLSKLDDKWNFAPTFGYQGDWRESLRKRT